MSSNIYLGDFHTSNRVLKLMMAKAGYVTSRMRPLSGPLEQQSVLVLRKFMSGVMHDQTLPVPPFPFATASFGTS